MFGMKKELSQYLQTQNNNNKKNNIMNKVKNALIAMNEQTLQTIESFERQLASCKKVGTAYAFVCEVGLRTIVKNNETGTCAYKNYNEFPAQWNMKGVNEIKQAFNAIGEEVKVYIVWEWYAKQIELLKGCIESNNMIIDSL